MGKKTITIGMLKTRVGKYNTKVNETIIGDRQHPGLWNVRRHNGFSSLCLTNEGLNVYLTKRGF